MAHDNVELHFRRYRATGEPEHLALVFDQLAPRLLLVAHHLTGRSSNAEDLVQDTFVRAIQIADEYDPARPLLPWLIGILAGAANNQRRRAQRTPDAARLRPADVPVPPELAEAEEFQRELTAAIERLGPAYRESLNLRLIHGLTATEIAHALGASPDTIKTRLRRGIEILRRALPAGFASVLAAGIAPGTALAAARRHVLAAAAQRVPPPAVPGETTAPPPTAVTAPAARGRLLEFTLTGVATAVTVMTMVLIVQHDDARAPVAPPVQRREVVTEPAPLPPPRVAQPSHQPAPPSESPRRPHFKGRLLTATGLPAPDTAVTLYRWAPDVTVGRDPDYLVGGAPRGPDFVAGRATTDGRGDFVIEGPWPRSLFLLRAGTATAVISETPTLLHPVDLGKIRSPFHGRITGRVTAATTQPPAGVRVRAVRLSASFLAEYPLHQLADAIALLPASSAGEPQAERPLWRHLLQVSPDDGGAPGLDRPQWFDRAMPLLPFEQATIDGRGDFAFDELARGSYTVVITAPGYQPLVLPGTTVTANHTTDLLTARLHEAGTIRGCVRDADGHHVAGAEVVLAAPAPDGAPFHLATARTVTDAHGNFAAAGAGGNAVVVAARRGPGDVWAPSVTAAIGSSVTIVLPHRHDLRFHLLSRSAGEIGTPRVQLLPGYGTIPLARKGYLEPLDLSARLSAGGHDRYTIADVPAGKYTLLIQTPAHELIAINVALQHDVSENFHLQPKPVYGVAVRDAGGRPVAGAEVFARGVSDHPRVQAATATTVYCGTTDAGGRIEIDHVPGTAAAISVVHGERGNGQLSIDAALPVVPSIRLRRPGWIRGTLTDGGATPQADEWMLAMTPFANQTVALRAAPEFATVDRQGSFERRALVDTDHRVRAVRSLATITSRAQVLLSLVSFAQPRPFVDTGATTFRPIELDTTAVVTTAVAAATEPARAAAIATPPPPSLATLTGLVHTSDGLATPKADVHLVAADGSVRRARADWQGKFAFPRVADGHWIITAHSHHPGRCWLEIDVAGATAAPIDLMLEPGVFVGGVVTAAGSLGSIQFIRQDVHGNWLADPVQLSLRPGGAFKPAILPPGRYQVTPGGLDMRDSYPYGHFITVGNADNFAVAVPQLVKNRTRRHVFVIPR